jgi:ribosomal protein S4
VPGYRVNKDAVKQARKLIDDGKVDVDTEWSDAAPSADDENAEIEKRGYDGYGAWHLAIDPDASEETKGRYKFPYGDFSRVNRAALIHAKQRAAQNGHDEIEKAADDLLQHLDRKRSA